MKLINVPFSFNKEDCEKKIKNLLKKKNKDQYDKKELVMLINTQERLWPESFIKVMEFKW